MRAIRRQRNWRVYVWGALASVAGAAIYAGWAMPLALPPPGRAAAGVLLITIGLNWLFGNSFHPDGPSTRGLRSSAGATLPTASASAAATERSAVAGLGAGLVLALLVLPDL